METAGLHHVWLSARFSSFLLFFGHLHPQHCLPMMVSCCNHSPGKQVAGHPHHTQEAGLSEGILILQAQPHCCLLCVQREVIKLLCSVSQYLCLCLSLLFLSSPAILLKKENIVCFLMSHTCQTRGLYIYIFTNTNRFLSSWLPLIWSNSFNLTAKSTICLKCRPNFYWQSLFTSFQTCLFAVKAQFLCPWRLCSFRRLSVKYAIVVMPNIWKKKSHSSNNLFCFCVCPQEACCFGHPWIPGSQW